ncbi:nucleobase-ascorbate transporter 6-like isoform X2 [Vicia villosa]|uniref:nucleobase-ascorbate transporter 6-like isoform X2 n=1 Tax=Vicia villosa TaxID=3911 RepID=UPI00273BD008|nr:nucleobase-ascorbate transporter 6-like isoform X2 [Vicia villosa]XP_058776796.1 nucleobase-ascorbate transporter 6-like isoform X2 [Vicia villosa]
MGNVHSFRVLALFGNAREDSTVLGPLMGARFRKSYDDSKSIVCLGSNHVDREFFWNSSTHDHRCFIYISAHHLVIYLGGYFVINVQKFVKIMNATQGALMVASTMQMVLGSIGGWRHVVSIFLIRRGDQHIFILDRFTVIFSILVVWTYAHILTRARAYKRSHTCRTDSAEIIGGALWG